MNKWKYQIILFCNKKRVKFVHGTMTSKDIYEYWRVCRTMKQPRFIKIHGGKRNKELTYELALIFPQYPGAAKVYRRDEYGRNVEAIMEGDTHRFKDIIPYWEEELIYDFQKKKHIKYDDLMQQIYPIKEISQIFTLNNKLLIQIEDFILMFGNKNLKDSSRLFDIIKEDVLKQKMGNFIFVKDVSTHQRILLYNMLARKKGFKRTELFRHYSY